MKGNGMKALGGRVKRLEKITARLQSTASAQPSTGGLSQDEALVAWVSWRLRQGKLTVAEREEFEVENVRA